MDEKRELARPAFELSLTDSADEPEAERDPAREWGGEGSGSLRFSVSERFWAFCWMENGDGDRGGDRAAKGDVGRGEMRWDVNKHSKSNTVRPLSTSMTNVIV